LLKLNDDDDDDKVHATWSQMGCSYVRHRLFLAANFSLNATD